ncbi:MAG: hypothetical protein IT373_09845 [Polyangiaceae bacterium]|nr:hypothetical protein [Polyangiaceae bacterium]
MSQQANVYPCPQCGGQLRYDAATQSMKCPYCGAQHAAPPQQAAPQPYAQAQVQQQPAAGVVREIPIEEGMRLAQRGYGTPVSQIECGECGATVTVNPNEQTVKCAFCSSQKVLPREAAGNVITPESLVPFAVDQNGANTKFTEWLAGLWFRPSDLKRMARVHEIGGLYVPFWTFDSMVHSRWTADAGYYYQETEWYTDAQGNRQTRTVTKTRWEPAYGARSDFYDDVIICASKGIPEALVDRFRTWDTKQLIPYQPSYLAGWKAESYAIDLMPGWQKAQDVIATSQRNRCSKDVPGDTQRNLAVNNEFSRVTFKHVLLPVWVAAYRYGGKPYQFLVNGQTGEVVGKAPLSFWKVFFLVLFIAAAVAAVVIVTQMRK